MLSIELALQIGLGLLAAVPQIPTGVSTFVSAWLAQLPALETAGVDIASFVEQQLSLVKQMITENRDPTDTEWSDLNAAMDDAHAKLQSDPAPTP
jgi:hypothetical protein